MKHKKIISLLAAAALFLSMGTGVFAAQKDADASPSVKATGQTEIRLADFKTAFSEGAASYNVGAHSYNWNSLEPNSWNWAAAAKSYLYVNSDGSLTRVELSGEKLVIETCASGFRLGSSKTIALELPIFGGFLAGSEYNFVVCGQKNEEESDSNEVVRVIKYDKSWNRLGSKSFYGCETYIPFYAGAVSMAEDAERLYIHTCHEMYKSGDGYHHQANMTFFVNKESMEPAYQSYTVWNISSGYVSHSFNQIIRTDGEYVYTADHGDAYPRAIVLAKKQSDGRMVKYNEILPIMGDTGANVTKATLGDMQLSSDKIITVGTSVAQDDSYKDRTQKNVFLSTVRKSDMSSQSLTWLTNYGEGAKVTVCNPYLVKVSQNSFVVMWEEYSDEGSFLRCAAIDGSGSSGTDIVSFKESDDEGLSDCAPIVTGGSIVWYSAGSRSDKWWNRQKAAPSFFRLTAGLSFARITSQPQNVTVNSGDNATFTVAASGTGLKYQWYYKKLGASDWSKWGTRTTASTTAKSNDSWDGMQVYCKITDSSGFTVNSEPATVTVNSTLTITAQPQDVTVNSGENATFTVKASGTGLKYQWYYKKLGASGWSKWGTRTTASTTAASNDSWDGMQVYCKVTDSKGHTVDSEPATVSVNSPLKITLQPQDVTVDSGDNATFTVKASGTGLKYQWYYKKLGASDWKKWGTRTTASTTAASNDSWNGMKVYCKVTDSKGHTVDSEPATVTVSSKFKITAQPQDAFVKSGDTVKFTVAASGKGLKYQWYYKKKGASKWSIWKNHATASTWAAANDSWNGMQVRCQVTDSTGETLYSAAAQIKICTERNMTVKAGSKVEFSVSADGKDLQYQWYYKKKGVSNWSIWKGHTDKSFTVTSNATWDGMLVYCRITDSTGADINSYYQKINIEQ